jgi:hypothetical protein
MKAQLKSIGLLTALLLATSLAAPYFDRSPETQQLAARKINPGARAWR